MKHPLQLTGLLLAAWCVMTLTHECGHLVGGWLGGGTLRQAELRPWHLPHSLFAPDPKPLLTLWCGPILGVAVPCGVAAVVRRNWMWLIANFCLLANGGYLALAWVSGDHLLDTARLLAAGAWPVSILVYCLLTVGFGYFRFRANVFEFLKTNGSQPGSCQVDRPSGQS